MGVLEGRIPDRQRVHREPDLAAQGLGGLAGAMAFGGQLEPAQRFDVELERYRAGRVVEAHRHRPVLIGAVERFVVGGVLGDVGDPEAAVGDVAVQLVGVRIAAPVLQAVLATRQPGQRADAGAADVVR